MQNNGCKIFFLCLILLSTKNLRAQSAYELNTGWKCKPIAQVNDKGNYISAANYPLSGWEAAAVPGTVLTTQIANKQVPDPFYGMNNKQIPDIFKTGRDYYTYWFVKDFKEAKPSADNQVYLNFRGVNYSFNVFLNGHQLNDKPENGMFLRRKYNITKWIANNGNNRLAVIVYPPNPVGNPNGGQGGDGTIARNVGIQYTAGWDWIQSIPDRNTGIWDKVTIEKTGAVLIQNPHIITIVPGIRKVTGPQQPAFIKVSAEMTNPTDKPVKGNLQYTIGGKTVSQPVTLQPNTEQDIQLPDLTLPNPKLWWPNGYGPQNLYQTHLQFITAANKVSDTKTIEVGVRQLSHAFNNHTQSQQINVNGQKIFIKGGNWIVSDELLRFSDKRYDAEIRFHHDMNLNLIRVWGGALTERPEFFAACDKYGMLVFQDMWGSGDCNGRWPDPQKLDDQATRRKYPDDHDLFLKSIADQVKMIRNYASLAIWCGGNEITPPEDILVAIRDTIMPKLDNTRWFVEFSNSLAMSNNKIGGNGDGPYGIQQLSTFYDQRTFPFNSEVGSVGINDYEGLKRFIPAANMVLPNFDAASGKTTADSVWDYHKYIGYDGFIDKYGKAKNVEDFAAKAQLVNYNQYRALMEGFSLHMWDWYTGTIIWKTQNPWTAMRGQMYDYYLDPNACLYGLHSGSEPLHVMYNPGDGMVSIINNTFGVAYNLTVTAKLYDMDGKETTIAHFNKDILPTSVSQLSSIKKETSAAANAKGVFLSLQLQDANKEIISANFYWLPDAAGEYSGLENMPAAKLTISAREVNNGKIEVVLTNAKNAPVAFFNRVSLINKATKKRILPVFYSDNYVSVLPGESKKLILDYSPQTAMPQVTVSGWNLTEKTIAVSTK